MPPRRTGLRRALCALTLTLIVAGCNAPPPTPAANPTAPPSSPTSIVSPTATAAVTPSPEPPPADRYAGWAMFAYPGETQATLEATLRRMKAAGANVVWIGHNNPGEVIAGKNEPGLSYAVWAAAQSQNATALAIIEAQHRVLRAARTVGLPVVFPIGYQGHMGQAWNDQHPKLLRHDAEGQWLNLFNGGISASPYSAEYRRDIRAYYEWVHDEFVTPYRDVILMLNLADEPLGGDYSQPAKAEFIARTGTSFADADPAQLGAFQDGVIVDYAVWSAAQWLELAPDMPVTMSFCGSQGRWSYGMPNIEALFRDTPRNFVVTFDAYVHDYLPWEPLTEAEVGSLALFARTAGYYSARYNRELWLWSAANRWGLAGYGSSNPGGVSDAVANGYLLALAARSTGGHLRGIGAWNYNVREQGLYGDSDPAPYDREAMFTRVSESFADWRRLMAAPAGRAEVLLYLSQARRHAHLGGTRNAVQASPLNFDSLLPLTRMERPTAFISHLPEDLSEARSLFVLDPTPDALSADVLRQLQDFIREGGIVWSTSLVAEALYAGDETLLRSASSLVQNPLAMMEADWAGLFGDEPGIRISSNGVALIYLPAGERAALPLDRAWRVFDRGGGRRVGATELREHEFALWP